uniref:SSD domain-containing protein n=1 Tax=Syphacia muris TaxID=451379 RepID=A0A0N5ASY9_9BILA
MSGGGSVEHYVRKFFIWYGFMWRWLLFLSPIFISAALSVGLFRLKSLKIDDPSYVFTPRNARWKKEAKILQELWPLNENKFVPGKSFEMKRSVFVLVRAKDGGDVLRPHVLDEAEILNQWILNNITVETAHHKYLLNYQDLCLSYDWVCGGNEHILMLKERRRLAGYIDLKFPKGGTTDTPVYLGTALGGVTLNQTDNTILSAKMVQMTYFLKQETDVIAHYSSQFEYAVEQFLLHKYNSDIIEFSFAHQNSLKDGLEQNAHHFTPNFVFSFGILSLYAIIFSFTFRGKWSIDPLRSKPYVACAGLLTTLLSLLSSFGILLLLGIPYNVINTIIPFLLIAIGIDDMFIMNACWDQTNSKLPPEKRMSETLAHAGVAVSITNITDILSFAIGCITELPGIELFCIYACCSIVFCYVYQLTFFAGFQAIMGDVEAKGRHCLHFCKFYFLAEQRVNNNTNTKTNKSCTRYFFGHIYGPFLMRTEMRALTCLFYLLFIVFAIAGCINYKEGLNPENLVTNNHYIAAYFRDMKQFWVQGPQVHVVVQKPPNFTDPVQRGKMLKVVEAFENTKHTLGREGTVFFLLEYLNYLNQVNAELEDTERMWNTKLRSWLKYTGGSSQWASDIKYNKDDNSIEAFRFQVAAKNIVYPDDHKNMALLLRDIADRQPFDVQVFHETFPFADQYIMIIPATARNVMISLVCMSLVALLLVPSLLSCVLIILSIISISAGMFGYMTFWGVNLDAISMISIIMIDLSSHISYAFVTANGGSKKRVITALETLGWPIFQGATSTIAGISILYTVNAYIILTFFKTIWLTMVIGMLHGLMFIPVVLSFIPISLFKISRNAELQH